MAKRRPTDPARVFGAGAPAWARLQRAIEVTRVARVTGLDRTGVEVACAVRPRGHVLQVCNGKGESLERAARGALLEAAELWGAERVDPTQLVWGSRDELRARLRDEVWDAAELGSAGALIAPRLWGPRVRLAWRVGVELQREAPVLIPAQAIHCPPAGSPPLGPAVVSWTSNGMGAHPELEAARLHALLEAVERDQLARALPGGWTASAIRRRMLDPRGLARAAPRTAARASELARRGFDVHLFDLAAGARPGLPVAGALLIDRSHHAVPLTAGYACALRRDDALLSALLEAAQSRLTDIHGAREDVAPADARALEVLGTACARARPVRSAASMPDVRAPDPVREVLRRLRGAGRARAAEVALAPPELGVHVVKVVIPGLLVSELL